MKDTAEQTGGSACAQQADDAAGFEVTQAPDCSSWISGGHVVVVTSHFLRSNSPLCSPHCCCWFLLGGTPTLWGVRSTDLQEDGRHHMLVGQIWVLGKWEPG